MNSCLTWRARGFFAALSLSVLALACTSGGGAGPGGGGSGGSSGAAGRGGDNGTAGTSGDAGSGGGPGGAGGSAGATGGTGGGAGASGGRGGAGGGAGAGGAGGAGGSGGSAGMGGRGGASGAGGTGGSAGATGGAGAGGGGRGGAGGATGGTGGATSSSLKLEYQNDSSTATAFSIRLTNLGPSMPLISAIKLRYYFSDDSTNGNANAMVTAARWEIANPATSINLRMGTGCSTLATFPATKSAYVDFGCSLTSPMNAQDALTMTVTIDPALQIPTNDYSFINTNGALAPNDHMLVLLNGVVVAGTPPP